MCLVCCRYIYVITFAMYSFWVPQIVSCIKNDARQPLKPVYIIGISVTRLALPLYIYGCPKNLLEEPPSPRKCLALCFFVAAQVGRCTAFLSTFPLACLLQLAPRSRKWRLVPATEQLSNCLP